MSLLGSIGSAVLGGLLGGGSSGGKTTQKQELDPRMANYIYGPDGKGGLLSDAYSTYRNQMDQGGLNPMQIGGMEMKRQTLMSPQYSQGYDAMRSLGLGLLGGGVAGNPFTNGRQAIRPNTNLNYQPFQYSTQGVQQPVLNALLNPIQQQTAPERVAPQENEILALIDEYLKKNGLGKYAVEQYINSGGGYDGGFGGFGESMGGAIGAGGGGFGDSADGTSVGGFGGGFGGFGGGSDSGDGW